MRCTQVRIDHRNGTVHFGGLEVESDQLRDHIAVLTKRLTKAVGMIYPAQNPDREARRLQVRERHCAPSKSGTNGFTSI